MYLMQIEYEYLHILKVNIAQKRLLTILSFISYHSLVLHYLT